MKTKLSQIPYGNAYVLHTDNGTVLYSYVTPVAQIDNDGWLTVFGLYSMTTRKHIGAYMREYAKRDYQLAKGAYLGGYDYNLFTGEIRPSIA